MDRPTPTPPAATPCPNPKCFGLPEATAVCRYCGTPKTGAKISAAFRGILRGEPA